MGTMTKRIADMQIQRVAYQLKKTAEEMKRIASYMSEEEREIFFSGNGFVRVPAEDMAAKRIDSYPQLIP